MLAHSRPEPLVCNSVVVIDLSLMIFRMSSSAILMIPRYPLHLRCLCPSSFFLLALHRYKVAHFPILFNRHDIGYGSWRSAPSRRSPLSYGDLDIQGNPHCPHAGRPLMDAVLKFHHPLICSLLTCTPLVASLTRYNPPLSLPPAEFL